MYLDNFATGPVNDNMVTFFTHCLELPKREYTFDVFRLRCLCPCHVCPKLPLVRLGSPVHDEETVLSSSIELSQNYRMSFQLESNFTADPESVQRCVELLDEFED